MENGYLLVITIVGAESSGKTMLAKQLAEALSCRWIPEYAREYLEKLDRPYEFEDLEVIARGQWASNPLQDFPPGLESTMLTMSLKGVNKDFSFLKSADFNDFILKVKLLESDVVIVDSGMLTIRMWSRIKFGKTIPFVEEKLREDPTSIYLLCRPRMEWEHDLLREAPYLVERVWIFNQYLKELTENNLPFLIVVT